jgi:hypothetical protein
MKEYIARFGHGSAKLARQAQSKEKTLQKMVADGLTEKVEKESTLTLKFANVGKLPPPVLQVLPSCCACTPCMRVRALMPAFSARQAVPWMSATDGRGCQPCMSAMHVTRGCQPWM